MASLGMITSVDIDEEERRVYVSVVVTPERTYNDIMYTQPADNIWMVPQEKDLIEVYEREDGRFAARNPEGKTEHNLPSGLSEGDIAIKTDSDTEIVLDKQANGVYNLRITAGGELHLNANQIMVGEDGNRTPVADSSHTHDYEDTLSDGSTTTKTTNGPNSGGLTNTEVE